MTGIHQKYFSGAAASNTIPCFCINLSSSTERKGCNTLVLVVTYLLRGICLALATIADQVRAGRLAKIATLSSVEYSLSSILFSSGFQAVFAPWRCQIYNMLLAPHNHTISICNQLGAGLLITIFLVASRTNRRCFSIPILCHLSTTSPTSSANSSNCSFSLSAFFCFLVSSPRVVRKLANRSEYFSMVSPSSLLAPKCSVLSRLSASSVYFAICACIPAVLSSCSFSRERNILVSLSGGTSNVSKSSLLK